MEFDPEDEIESDSFSFQFELVETDDPETLVLVCVSSRPLSPEDYAQALISYAQQIIGVTDVKDLDKALLN